MGGGTQLCRHQQQQHANNTPCAQQQHAVGLDLCLGVKPRLSSVPPTRARRGWIRSPRNGPPLGFGTRGRSACPPLARIGVGAALGEGVAPPAVVGHWHPSVALLWELAPSVRGDVDKSDAPPPAVALVALVATHLPTAVPISTCVARGGDGLGRCDGLGGAPPRVSRRPGLWVVANNARGR